METALIIIISAVVLILAVLIFYFNRLIHLRNKVDNAWHQIDVELKRRHSLVPELVEVVKGFSGHERTTFERVAGARAKAMEAPTVAEKGPAEDGLTGAVRSVFAVAESYPLLKANEEFAKLAKQISETENRIAGSRKYYNGAVMYYDNARQGFPGNIIAGLFRGVFPDREYFELKDIADREPPSADLTSPG